MKLLSLQSRNIAVDLMLFCSVFNFFEVLNRVELNLAFCFYVMDCFSDEYFKVLLVQSSKKAVQLVVRFEAADVFHVTYDLFLPIINILWTIIDKSSLVLELTVFKLNTTCLASLFFYKIP